MKKLATALLIASSTSFAGTMGPAHVEPNYNFFVGATAGIASTIGSANFTTQTETGNFSAGANSFIGGGLIGVQKYFQNNVYAALALNGLYNSYNQNILNTVETTNQPTDGTASIKNYYQYGANIRLGKKLDTDMISITPYLLGGVEAGQFTYTGSWRDNGIAGAASTSKTLAGFQGGLGTLVSLTSNVNVGLEYAHTWFGNTQFVFSDQNITNNIQQDQVLLSVNYLF